MRIIAGTLRGRRLKSPSWDGLRPTSDRLRETLFNILASRVPGARVLDGYAGTGAVGIEALSRGAAVVSFVDRDRRATALIEANLAACGQRGGYTIECRDVEVALQQMPRGVDFDLILLDPPYDIEDVSGVLHSAGVRLAPGGLLVLERATRRDPSLPASLVREREVRAGDSTLTFLTRHP